MGSISDPFGVFGSNDDASDAAIEASETQADYQREALEYLKETEALPQSLREASLLQFADLYGLNGAEAQAAMQQTLISQAQASPLYSAMMSSQAAGEESILRNQAATGGLRSGDTQGALAKYNTELQNTALLEAYNQQISGLGSLAQLPSLAQSIGSGMATIGTTLAQGQIAAAQADQVSSQNSFSNLLGASNIGLKIWGMF